jgi:hypothetical protein
MTGLVRKASLFVVCGLLAASAASASTPSAANSVVPGAIQLVGNNSGVKDVVDANFTIIVRDLNNLPVNNSFVIIDFATCHNLNICSDQMQAGITAVCPSQVRGFTGPAGTLSLSITGHANNSGGDTSPTNGNSGSGCATVEADGTPLKANIRVATYDQDGNGVAGADLAAWLGDNFGIAHAFVPQHPDRSDYDGSGGVGGADLALWLSVNFGVLNGFVPASINNCPGNTPQCTVIP